MRKILAISLVIVTLTACDAVAVPTDQPVTVTASLSPPTPQISPTPTPTPQAATSTLDTRILPEEWQTWPVVPETVSARVRQIYLHGLELGNNQQAYSKIGDCDASTDYFLEPFDGDPVNYSLGEYTSLISVVDYFRGSHGRTSLASGIGYSTAAILAPFRADPNICESNETPLACEVRVHRPSYVLLALGSNDIYHQDTFDDNMRQILDFLIEKGVVPILSTKADNLEGDQAINLEIARLAYEYELPLWNFWLVVQPLPAHGLQEDGAHLTYAGPFFDDPERMRSYAWPWRNLTALQTLESVWRGATANP